MMKWWRFELSMFGISSFMVWKKWDGLPERVTGFSRGLCTIGRQLTNRNPWRDTQYIQHRIDSVGPLLVFFI